MQISNHCNLLKEAIEWINGELLGDGCLHSYSTCSAQFRYSSKYLEYIKYVSDILKSFGIKQAGRIYKNYHKKRDYCGYRYNSCSYCELLFIHKKWYPKDKKIIPKDIKLTPLTCRQWYIGDGTISHRYNRRPFIKLYTNGLTIDNVKWLVRGLNNIGFKATRQSIHNEIHISSYSTKDFLNYIGKCPVDCYKYKFSYERKMVMQ